MRKPFVTYESMDFSWLDRGGRGLISFVSLSLGRGTYERGDFALSYTEEDMHR